MALNGIARLTRKGDAGPPSLPPDMQHSGHAALKYARRFPVSLFDDFCISNEIYNRYFGEYSQK